MNHWRAGCKSEAGRSARLCPSARCGLSRHSLSRLYLVVHPNTQFSLVPSVGASTPTALITSRRGNWGGSHLYILLQASGAVTDAISNFVTVQPLLFVSFSSGGFQHVIYRLPKPRCGSRSCRDCALHKPASATYFGVVARFGDDYPRLRQRVFHTAGSPTCVSTRERFLRGEASWARIGA
jgi:hypothetical protein